MKVFVSGSSSHLARALLPRLCADPAVTDVTGIDLLPPVYAHEKFRALQADLRSAPLLPLLADHDALIHLAYVVLRGKMRASTMHEINVATSLALFRAARAAGVTRLVHLSSAAVYGAGVDLTENAPLNPLPGFLYAQHKCELEQLLATEFPDLIVLRPHLILGPHAQPLLRFLARQPFYPALPDPQPLLQCVHEDDVAQAILLCLERKARGAFNLATEDSYSFREMVRARHRVGITIPLPLLKFAARVGWQLSGWGGEPGWLQGIDHSITLNCRKAHQELGWRPHHSAQETLAAL